MQRVQSPLDQTFSMSRLAMGLWRLVDWEHSPAALVELTEKLLEMGVTTFDLADIYGDYRCEALYGEALRLAPGLRQGMEVVSKCGIKLCGADNDYRLNHYDSSAHHVTASVESSLGKLGTDYLDLLLLHRPDPLVNADELAAALQGLLDSGKVRAVGVSNFMPHQFELLQSRLDAPLVVNQIEVSPLHCAPMFDGQLDFCQQHQVVPMAWSPFGGGELFTGRSESALRVQACLEQLAPELGLEPQQLVLAWLLRHPSNMVPVLGSGNMARLQSAAKAVTAEIPREAWFLLLRAARGRDVD